MFPCARQLEVQIHPVDMLATPGAAGDTGHPESGPIIPFGVFSSQTRDESVPNLTETKLTFLSNSPFEQHLISNLAVGSQTTDKNPTEAESNNHFHSKFVSYFWCIPFSAPICANNVAPETRSEETDEPHFESNHDTYISSYVCTPNILTCKRLPLRPEGCHSPLDVGSAFQETSSEQTRGHFSSSCTER